MSRPSDIVSREVKRQYESFPYPPVPALALPKSGQGHTLRYERGTKQAWGQSRSHRGIRILVAGAGTLEALLVSEAHPFAREVVAVDLSQASLKKLKLRKTLSKIFPWKPRCAPIREVCADLLEWNDGLFDYILASNVLHHCLDPGALLTRLSSWLRPEGILRVVTYPKASRLWMRETSRFLKSRGLAPEIPELISKSHEAIHSLPETHPIRSCFESHPEIKTAAGLVDAFFNSCETPLSPLEWKSAAAQASLSLVAEDQSETSCSKFVDEILGRSLNLDAFQKLEIMDLTLELCSNPVLWFKKETGFSSSAEIQMLPSAKPVSRDPDRAPSSDRILDHSLSPERVAELIRPLANQSAGSFLLPSRVRWELGTHLRTASAILDSANATLEEWLEQLKTQVGPRTFSGKSERVLAGLSIGEYQVSELNEVTEPWTDNDWETLQRLCSSKIKLSGYSGKTTSLANQAQVIQTEFGPAHSWIPISFEFY